MTRYFMSPMYVKYTFLYARSSRASKLSLEIRYDLHFLAPFMQAAAYDNPIEILGASSSNVLEN